MTNNIETLKQRNKELLATNVSIKSKYDTLKNLEKNSFEKLMKLDQTSQDKIVTLENDYIVKNKERLEIETNNRLLNVDLSNERSQNQELEFILKSANENQQARQLEFEKENIDKTKDNTDEKIK